MRTVWIAVLACVALAATLPAEEAAKQAGGTFESKAWKLELVGAYAFPVDEVGFDDEPGIKVVVSNRGFRAEWVDRYYDREQWIDERFKNDEDFVVYFDFDLKGAYQGMTYYFESGDGCGFCYNGATVSTVKIVDGRIKGHLTLPPKDDDAHYDLQFDVPIASQDHGKALPADGGEPGKVYAAYHQALVDWKVDGVQSFLTAENAENYGKDKEKAFHAWNNDHPTQSYKIVKAFEKGDQALLVVEGTTPAMGLVVQVLMDKENGVWKIADELPKVKFGE